MCELGLNHVVDFGRAETDAGGVEDSVRAAEEEDLFGFWVNGDEVAVGPYVFCGFVSSFLQEDTRDII